MVYFVIPKIVLDPASGGDYIPKMKNIKLKKEELVRSTIEFYEDSIVVPGDKMPKAISKYPYVLAESESDKGKMNNVVKDAIKLKDLKPKDVYGTKLTPDFRIKFIQTYGDSYKLTPKMKSGSYNFRPKSWYFLTGGRVTLGVRSGIDQERYREVCENVYKFTQKVAGEVRNKKKSLKDAQKELKHFIDLNNPIKYVNPVILAKNTIVEFATGGIHNSIEGHPSMPNGNLLYEVEKDIDDDKADIEAFGKGYIWDKGEYKKVKISDYLDNLDKNVIDNDPNNIIRTRIKLKDLKNWKLNKNFYTPHYQMDELIINAKKDYRIDQVGFRHIFVMKGKGEIKTGDGDIEIREGNSYIVTADSKKLTIKNTEDKPAEDAEDQKTLRLFLTYRREHLK